MYEGVVQDLIDELGRLPGVGPKSAQRIAFHILQAEPTDVRRLANALMEVKAKVRFCGTCGNVAQEEQCRVCLDPRRDPAVICSSIDRIRRPVSERSDFVSRSRAWVSAAASRSSSNGFSR